MKRETKALDISYTIHNSQEWNEERKAWEGEGSVKWEKKNSVRQFENWLTNCPSTKNKKNRERKIEINK